MTEYVTGQIYGWNGGECPVHFETEVNVWFRGQEPELSVKADYVAWKHCNSSFQANSDIIAFQVITPYAEPKTIWVNEFDSGAMESFYSEAEAKKWVCPRHTRIAVKYVEVKE